MKQILGTLSFLVIILDIAPTTYNIKSTVGDKREDVKWSSVTFVLKAPYKYLGLFIEHMEEASQNLEVESWSEQLPTGLPLRTSAANKCI